MLDKVKTNARVLLVRIDVRAVCSAAVMSIVGNVHRWGRKSRKHYTCPCNEAELNLFQKLEG